MIDGLRVRTITNWVPISLVVIAFFGLGTTSLLHGNIMSLFDEWGYLDYLFKIPTQGMVLKGEFYGTQALDLMACKGEIPFGVMGGACGSNYDPSTFPNGGIVTSDPYTPFYFWITWLFGWFFDVIPGINSVAAWRLSNILWLCAGLITFYRLGRFWKAPKLAIFAIGLIIIGSPFSYWAYTYVSTDAPSFFFGALLLLLASKYSRGETSSWLLILVSVIATLFKVTNILAVCAIALYLFSSAIYFKLTNARYETETDKILAKLTISRSLVVSGLALALSVVAEISWLKLHDAIAATSASVDQGINSALTWFELLRLTSLTTSTLGMTIPVNGLPGLNTLPLPDYVLVPLMWVLAAGVIAAFWSMKRGSRRNPLVITAFLTMIIAGPLLAIALQVMAGSYFVLPPRYMAPVLAILLLPALFTMKNKIALWILSSYGLILLFGLISASFVISTIELGG